jgi:hypothetical protein
MPAMPPRRSVSFPLYIEESAAAARDAARTRRLVRLGLVAWAALVYLLYWLGQLGMR